MFRMESATALLKRLRVISTDCARLIPRLNCPWEAAVASLVRDNPALFSLAY
jgi:hypothetical protein